MNEDRPTKGERREAARRKARYGMRVSGRSTLTVLVPTIGRKAKEARKKRRP